MRTLSEAKLSGKTVLYRPDYNVPMENGQIQDPFRITATFETIDFLRDSGAKIVIASHLGRPEGKENAEFSLRPVAEFLANHYSEAAVRVANEFDFPVIAEAVKTMQVGDIMILPNVRFKPEEEENDEAFGALLASLADVFVIDAFACAHRAHASVVRPAEHLETYPGFLMEREVTMLGSLLEGAEKPFVTIMGGAKVSDKIDVMKKVGEHADCVLVGGAMANTFLLAKGEDIGESMAEEEKVDVAKELIEFFGDKLVLAPDFVKDGEGEKFRYLDIGPKSIELFKEKMEGAKTIFWNGSLGYTEKAPYDEGSKAIAQYLAGLEGVTTIVAGGDTVEMLTTLGLHDKITFVSTGGGAALEFLGGNELPGVKILG